MRMSVAFGWGLVVVVAFVSPGVSLAQSWSKVFNSTAGLNSYGYGLATDASGNVLVTGEFRGVVDFGGGTITTSGVDIFVAKFAPDGTHLWSKGFGDGGLQTGHAVAADASGNVIVTGEFGGVVDFGGGPLVFAGGTSSDIFLVKFDPNGTHLWSKRFGDGSQEHSYGVATDSSGNIIIAGAFAGTVNFGGGTLTSAGNYDIFVAKFAPDGTHLWSQGFGDTLEQHCNSMAVDPSGNVILTGEFSGAVNFGGTTLTDAGNGDIFVAKFAPDGMHLWSKSFGDASGQYARGIAADALGNILVTGHFVGAVNFEGTPLLAAGDNLYVAKFAADGTGLWSRRCGNGLGIGEGIATDAAGNVLVTGRFNGAVDFGGGAFASSGYDIFVAKYAGDGTHRWSGRFGAGVNDPQYGECVATDPAGNVVVTGEFRDTVNFGGGDLTSVGNLDIFLAKFGNLPTAAAGVPLATIALEQNRPNPFNPATEIGFSIGEADDVHLAVYGVRGALVRNLVSRRLAPGQYGEAWNGRDERGREMPSGIYFYRLTVGTSTLTRKAVLLR